MKSRDEKICSYSILLTFTHINKETADAQQAPCQHSHSCQENKDTFSRKWQIRPMVVSL